MEFPYRKQETDWSCGSASTRMVLEACGVKKTEKQVIALLGTNKIRGTWAKMFPRVFEKYKLDYVVMRNAEIKDMIYFMKKKYFILTSFFYPKEKVDHFVVVKKIDDEFIYFHDPWFGPKHKYSLAYFKKIWRTDPAYDDEWGWFIAIKKP